ncbi:hypothetical protein GALL_401850 [mine drainage metagenome]|uniref:Uncharacterized protein n=1 Tax=mine drainage metagenome TaxID=410659 RepID=A0A1J5Q463_9ZZZZ
MVQRPIVRHRGTHDALCQRIRRIGLRQTQPQHVACRFDRDHAGQCLQGLRGGRTVHADQQAVALAAGPQLIDRAAEHQLSLMDDLHVIAHHLDLRQDVGGQNHAVLATQLLDQRTDITNLDRIESTRRLVQHYHHRAMDDGLGDAHALLVTGRQVLAQSLAHIVQAGTFLGIRHGARHPATRHAMHAGRERQHLVHGQFLVQRRRFRQVADQRLGFPGVFHDVDTANPDRARGRREVSGQHFHGGGLARTIGTQKTQHLTLAQVEVHVAHHGIGSVDTRQVAHLDGYCIHCRFRFF